MAELRAPHTTGTAPRVAALVRGPHRILALLVTQTENVEGSGDPLPHLGRVVHLGACRYAPRGDVLHAGGRGLQCRAQATRGVESVRHEGTARAGGELPQVLGDRRPLQRRKVHADDGPRHVLRRRASGQAAVQSAEGVNVLGSHAPHSAEGRGSGTGGAYLVAVGQMAWWRRWSSAQSYRATLAMSPSSIPATFPGVASLIASFRSRISRHCWL